MRKSKIAIISSIILVAIIFVGISMSAPVGDLSPMFGPKYQYKFWQENLEFENGSHFTRVLYSRSDDYGKTFSEPVDMSMTKENAHEPEMILMDGDVILVWRDEVPNDNVKNLSFAKSTDYGQTFEKKRIFNGARPSIVHYGDVLYLTWVGHDLKEIWYSDSYNRGETFSDPILLFEIDWDLSPYEERPTPEIRADDDSVTVSWKMRNMTSGGSNWIVWNAVDQGKDRSFEVTSFISQE